MKLWYVSVVLPLRPRERKHTQFFYVVPATTALNATRAVRAMWADRGTQPVYYSTPQRRGDAAVCINIGTITKEDLAKRIADQKALQET